MNVDFVAPGPMSGASATAPVKSAGRPGAGALDFNDLMTRLADRDRQADASKDDPLTRPPRPAPSRPTDRSATALPRSSSPLAGQPAAAAAANLDTPEPAQGEDGLTARTSGAGDRPGENGTAPSAADAPPERPPLPDPRERLTGAAQAAASPDETVEETARNAAAAGAPGSQTTLFVVPGPRVPDGVPLPTVLAPATAAGDPAVRRAPLSPDVIVPAPAGQPAEANAAGPTPAAGPAPGGRSTGKGGPQDTATMPPVPVPGGQGTSPAPGDIVLPQPFAASGAGAMGSRADARAMLAAAVRQTATASGVAPPVVATAAPEPAQGEDGLTARTSGAGDRPGENGTAPSAADAPPERPPLPDPRDRLAGAAQAAASPEGTVEETARNAATAGSPGSQTTLFVVPGPRVPDGVPLPTVLAPATAAGDPAVRRAPLLPDVIMPAPASQPAEANAAGPTPAAGPAPGGRSTGKGGPQDTATMPPVPAPGGQGTSPAPGDIVLPQPSAASGAGAMGSRADARAMLAAAVQQIATASGVAPAGVTTAAPEPAQGEDGLTARTSGAGDRPGENGTAPSAADAPPERPPLPDPRDRLTGAAQAAASPDGTVEETARNAAAAGSPGSQTTPFVVPGPRVPDGVPMPTVLPPATAAGDPAVRRAPLSPDVIVPAPANQPAEANAAGPTPAAGPAPGGRSTGKGGPQDTATMPPVPVPGGQGTSPAPGDIVLPQPSAAGGAGAMGSRADAQAMPAAAVPQTATASGVAPPGVATAVSVAPQPPPPSDEMPKPDPVFRPADARGATRLSSLFGSSPEVGKASANGEVSPRDLCTPGGDPGALAPTPALAMTPGTARPGVADGAPAVDLEASPIAFQFTGRRPTDDVRQVPGGGDPSWNRDVEAFREAVMARVAKGAGAYADGGQAREQGPGRQSQRDSLPVTSVPAPVVVGNAPVVPASTGLSPGPAAPGSAVPLDVPQIIRAVRLQWQNGVGEARVQLRPEHLGQVTVELRVAQGAVVVAVHAETQAARQWIQNHQADLKAALVEQGLRLDELVVTADGERRQQQETPERPRRAPRGERRPKTGAQFDIDV